MVVMRDLVVYKVVRKGRNKLVLYTNRGRKEVTINRPVKKSRAYLNLRPVEF